MSKLLAFDIGHASIGWSVLESLSAEKDPEILGTGVVLFPTDDCLASQRRDFRRTRRHIRSTRQRIERMKRWLEHRGVLGRADLDKPGHPAPFLLAASALRGKHTLNAWELWTVLRWYAHNRGYDGNARWSSHPEDTDEEDTEKVSNARTLMNRHGTDTMAETVCACLKLNPAKPKKRISSWLPYKTLNAAFPRETVEQEVADLLKRHIGKISGLDGTTVRLLLKNTDLSREDRAELKKADIKLPLRYQGGLLFGQLVPRFDNRIISTCPITYAEVFDREVAAGKPETEARRAAKRESKVPAARCREFLEYRFARVLANIRADGEPLDAETRKALFDSAKRQGYFTAKELGKEIERLLGEVPTNLENYFNLHPDSEKALVLDPAAKLVSSNKTLKPLLEHLPEKALARALRKWRANRPVLLGQLLEWSAECGPTEALEAALSELHRKNTKKGKRKGWSFAQYLMLPIRPEEVSGRAPYARPVLRRVVEEVLRGEDPTKPARSAQHPEGEEKPADGVLYALLDPKSRVRQLQDARPLAELTNNHLVRHRLLILERLLDDIVEEFCDGKPEQVRRVVVEVARELKEFSGKTAKEIAAELKGRLKDFKAAVAHLEKFAPGLKPTGGLIRKCRIAMDLGWECPFTGDRYEAQDLPNLQREHIIPYASRATNALHALVLTWPEVNAMKGKRTARQFVKDDQSKTVPGRGNLSIRSLSSYDAFVEKLDTKGHPDDQRRKKARKALLQTTEFEEREQEFTPAQLTGSSHLMKLALRGVAKRFPNAACDPIPGIVTSMLRKSWDLAGTLALACPEIETEDESGKKKTRPKGEIREITHLHHALDASVLALAAHYLPLQLHGRDIKGKLWEALLKRNPSPEETRLLKALKIAKIKADGGAELIPPPDGVKNALATRLAECRVMQHVPADRSGLPADQLQWRFHGWNEQGRAIITKHSIKELDELGRRKRVSDKPKSGADGKNRVFGVNPTGGNGKLAANKAVIILNENYGIALLPEPQMIKFHKVSQRLERLRQENGGKLPPILRRGQLIRIRSTLPKASIDYRGIWRVASLKNKAIGIKLTLIRPERVTVVDHVDWAADGTALKSLLQAGLKILLRRYTGYPKE